MKTILSLVATAALTLSPAWAVEPGEQAPDFTLSTPTGEKISLADYAGKAVVLEWTNPDCPFVHKHYDTGAMQKLQQQHLANGGVWIVLHSAGEGKASPTEKVVGYLEKSKSKPTALVLDPDGSVGKLYGATNTPHMIVINKEGKVAYAGGIDDKPDTDHASVETAKNYVVEALEALSKGEEVEVKKGKPYGCPVRY